MRTVVALCFLALFAGALAHKKAPLEDSKLVSALKDLFQIADEDEFDQVADILAHVQGEIEDLLSQVRSNYGDAEADHDDVESQYEADIDNLNNQLAQTQTDLNNAQGLADDLQETIDNSLDAINEAQADQDIENARRADYHNAFRTLVGQLNDAVDATEDALRLLQEIDTQDLEGSFLEINNKKIKEHFEAIHKGLSDLKLKNPVAPITKMLVEIAAEGINHGLIAQIEDLLNQLLDTLNAEIDAAVQDDNNDDAYSRNTLQTLQDTIDLESNSAEQNQEQLADIEGTISLLTDSISNLSSTLQNAQAALDAFESQWDDTSSNYDALIKRLLQDIDAIEAAEKFVDRD